MPRGEGGDPAMAHRLFEGKEHAEAYLRFRVSPSDQLIQQVVDFVQKQVGPISRTDRGQCGCTTHVASCTPVHNAIYGNTHTHTHTEKTHMFVWQRVASTCCLICVSVSSVFVRKGGLSTWLWMWGVAQARAAPYWPSTLRLWLQLT